jgi:predicted nuclease of predicted toxin-antitoxin system
MSGASDLAQLQFAAASSRVLVTHDADFLRLHTEGVPHAGIAYCHQQSKPVGDLLRRLISMHNLLEPEEMAGRVEFL